MLTALRPHRFHGRPVDRVARATALFAGVLAVCATLALISAKADAHPLSTSAILLEIGSEQVTGQVQLPIDRLAIALNQPLTASIVAQPGELEKLRVYVAAHICATDPVDGAQWGVAVTGGRVENIDAVDHLVFGLLLRPRHGAVRNFALHFDAIVHRLLSHRIFVSSRTADTDTDTYTVVGLLDWQSQTLAVEAHQAITNRGFMAAVGLGVTHIAEGADHLLFLMMLLLPTPLLATGGRWVRADSLRRNSLRVVHVVTAFAIGHSITLALAAFGYISVPTRVVESLIALSILVSAVHAIKPIVRGGDIWIAAGFGLMHGLAFAALLDELNLNRGSLVTELLGFNLGIELTQLIVVVLVMPSLMLLSCTEVYTGFRAALASFGIILAAAWLAESVTLIDSNPLDGISDVLVAHPFTVAAALALGAVLIWTTLCGLNARPKHRDHSAPAMGGKRVLEQVIGLRPGRLNDGRQEDVTLDSRRD